VVSSLATFFAARAYLRRQPTFRFGILGTTVLIVLVWTVTFVAVFALGTNSWANIK
jgi:hypothetical protein